MPALTSISERDNPTTILEQRLKDLQIVTNYPRSLVNNSVSYEPRHRTSTDTDQGPIYIQRDTDREWTSPDGTATSYTGQSIGAMVTLPASSGRPLRQVSRHAVQRRGSGTTQREPSRGSENLKGRQIFTSNSPTHIGRASMERSIPDAHPLGPTTTEWRSPLRCPGTSHRQSSPRSHQRQGRGSRARTHQETVSRQLSIKSFFSSSQRQWEHRDNGAHEPEMSSGLRHRSP